MIVDVIWFEVVMFVFECGDVVCVVLFVVFYEVEMECLVIVIVIVVVVCVVFGDVEFLMCLFVCVEVLV